MGKPNVGYRQVRHVKDGMEILWLGRLVVAPMDTKDSPRKTHSPLRQHLAHIQQVSVTNTEKYNTAREQQILDGVSPDRARLMCTEDFADILMDIIMDE